MKKSLFLLVIGAFGIVSVHAQKNKLPYAYGGVWSVDIPVSFLVNGEEFQTSYIGYNSEWQEGPFDVYGSIYLATPGKVKLSLYIPKIEFLDRSNKRLYLQGLYEPSLGGEYGEELDLTREIELLQKNYRKIYEVPDIVNVTELTDATDWPEGNNPINVNEFYQANFNYNWDGMTDPQFTGGVSYPVYDAVLILFEDAETGEIIRVGGPSSKSHYDTNIENSVKFTALENSVQADVWFATGGRPVKDVTLFLVDNSCTISNLKWSNFQISGAQAVVGAWGTSEMNYLKAYKSFADEEKGVTQYLEDVETGLYHLTWEIIGRDGKPYDRGPNTEYHVLGLIIEGTDVAVTITEKTGSVVTVNERWLKEHIPRPLNPDAVINYPEFEIVNGVLMHYFGTGGNVVIPNSVTKINNEAFFKNSSLTAVTIPDGVTNIGDLAFYECANLESVTIPNSVKSIGYRTFMGCKNLKSVTIPNSVTSIGSGAFAGCSNLTSVSISNNVTSIEDGVFSGCGFPSITIPNSITSIGKDAFSSCDNLSSVTIPNSVTSIGERAFGYCYHLSSVTISNSVTSIGESAFSSCSNLSSVTIPNSVTNIGKSAFSGCSLSSITIPNSVTTIGEGPFSFCGNLESIILEEGNQFYTMDDGVLFNKAKTILIQCLIQAKKEKYTVPDGVIRIGEEAFDYCETLTSVTIPNSVTHIGGSAFEGTNLASVVIPNSVTYLGDRAFGFCLKLKKVEVHWSKPLYRYPSWPIFFDYEGTIVKTAQLIVPKGTKSLYQTSHIWQDFGSIEEGDYTGIKTINAPFNVYLSDENLHVNSSVSEKIRIYSITGMLLYQTDKPAGEANFNIGNIRDKILIVRGDSGWVKKIIK
jgi:hypothetical protein